MGVRVDTGAHAQQHPLAPAGREHAGELGDVLEVVDDDPADAGAHRQRELVLGLRVAVQVDPLGLEPGPQGQVQLAAGRDVAAEPFLREHAQHGRGRAGLGREDDLAGAAVVGLERGRELARPGAQVVLRHHVRRRPVRARQLDRVAAADRQPAIVHGRGLGVDGAGCGGHDRCGSMTDSAFALAHAHDRPDGDPWGGLVILHGAGSRKENHADMARAAAAAGLAAVRFDMRGHGESGGLLDGRAIEDVAAAAALLPPGLPVALRGSSMGGYLALVAAPAAGAAAVVAICPAPAPLLARGLAQAGGRGRHLGARGAAGRAPARGGGRSAGDPGPDPARRGRRAGAGRRLARARCSGTRDRDSRSTPAATTARSNTTRAPRVGRWRGCARRWRPECP